jgi:5-methylthioadenosine/S-adenosylhomocysteine deaminase
MRSLTGAGYTGLRAAGVPWSVAAMATLYRADRAVVGGVARGPTAILEDGGAIVAIGAPAEVAADPRAAGATIVDWPRCAITPGTVNSHNHSFQSLLRGIGDDLPFLVWRERALYRYSPRLDAEGMHTAALFAFGEMLLHGVTTVCDFYYLNAGGNDHASATIEAARALGMRIVLARCFYDWDGAPASYRESIPTAIANFTALHRRYHDRDRYLVAIQPAPHSQHGATPAMIEAGAGCAKDAGVPWHIHLAEEAYQVEQSLTRFGQRPLHAVAALDVDLATANVVHACWFDAGERALLAERGGRLAYCPGSNMFLGDGITDVVDLRARGVTIGLGTDGGCSNNRVSVFDEMRACALLQKVARTDGQAIAAEDVWAMGTTGGAALLDLPVGDLAVGLRCDLVAVDLDDPSLWPEGPLAKNLVYALSPRAIRHVVVDGRQVVTDGRLTQVELAAIRARVTSLTHDWSSTP